MVFGITEWEEDREKESFHVQKKTKYPKTNHELNKFRDLNNKQLKERKKNAYTSYDAKTLRKFYAPVNRQTKD